MNTDISDSPEGRPAAANDDTSANLERVSMDVGSEAPSTNWTGVPAEDDRRLHNVGVAALAAVSQYPHAVNPENSSFLVSEVVHAMTGSNLSLHHVSSPALAGMESSTDAPSYPHRPESALSKEERSSESQKIESDVDMVSILQDLIERTPTRQNVATIANLNDADYTTEMMDYEPVLEENYTSPSSSSDDDLEDLIKFYPGEEEFYRLRNAPYSPESATHDVNLDEFYQDVSYDHPSMGFSELPGNATAPGGPFEAEEQPDPHPASIIHTTTYERNLTIDEFIQRWMVESNIIPHGFHSENRIPRQLRPLSKMMNWQPPITIKRPPNSGHDFDLQQIPWMEALKVKRSDARKLRDRWYTSYHNLDYLHVAHAEQLPEEETYFQAKCMHTEHRASIEHFQLRNLMSVPTYNTVHFASRSKIYSWTPAVGGLHCLIDLSRPEPEAGILGPVKISSMKSGHGLTVAGGFSGEYALRAASNEGSGAKGLVTPDFNDGITNHVDLIRNRSGRSPICVFASNDRHLRVLDCETNIFLSDQELSRPINCTATSPDSRLRVVIGDSPDAWVIESDTGRPVHPLRGHRDFGFACAWSPDMRHIATSNQDKTVIIWDARTWRVLETIDSDVAGYRSLRFSPVGGGPRTLLCSEPADRISIIDAQLFQTRQVHDFFGEIGGADYAPDGGSIWVANTDPHFGGFMQYECRQWGGSFGLADLPNEWVHEADLEFDDRCVLSPQERSLRFLRNLSDREHDAFVL
ncbi:uncharacterized protein N7459_002296 [Penicillium hispanicum]|uniref:uncharacterized protein n=1 Tax=Penicillium hispanicum TaxID=1080232 RepID=UPI0025404E67|nr:uncharacterized protein N7459_002296 [Penicillium hispanicum]KAJ5591927.1 hypothetical protein N7459_002296 [Penicillium hispanicum]